MTREIGMKRLLRLAQFLEREVPPENFNMETWGRKLKVRDNLTDCGSKACALGWASQIPEFQEAGLKSVWYPYATKRGAYLSVQIHHPDRLFPIRDSEAAQHFFSLSSSEVSRLFYGGPKHRTKTEVARNIRRFVKTGVFP